jgi:hypothetical protein
MSCFGSKHGSTTKLGGFADSKVSLVSNGQMDLEAAIKLLQEVKKNASPEDLAALHEVLQSADESNVIVPEPGLSRNTSVINRSSSSLTRRRSLIQTPGVATRNSPVEGRRRTWNSWKAPQLSPEEEAKWRAVPKSASRFTRLSALDLAEEGRTTPTPRAQTPGEMDYSHLGSLKLGTLMVTNGAPSPAPSAMMSMSKSRPGEDDYFSTAEAGSSPFMMKPTKRRGHTRSKSAIPPTTTPLYESDVPMPTMTARTAQAHTSMANQAPTSQREVQAAERRPMTTTSADTIPQNAYAIAQSYQAEIPMSPFATLPDTHMDVKNNGVVSEGSEAYALEAARIFKGTMFELDASAEATSLALTAAITCEPTTQATRPKSAQRPLPRTTDSGYSSGGSLRTTGRAQRNSGLSAVSGQRSDSPQKRDEVLEVCTPKSSPTEMHMPSISYEQTRSESAHGVQAQRRPAALKIFEQSSKSSARSSASEGTLSPQTPKSISSKASFDSTSSSQKRRHRKKPLQTDLPVVQSCQPIPEGTIPEVPENVRTKFTRRLSNTPGMECLTNTFPTKDHVLSAEPAADASSPAPITFQQLAEIEPERRPTPPAHRRRKSFSLFRRKSYVEPKMVEKADETPSLDVVDLGTIATSLGTSPYDIAMPGPARKAVTSPTHPHQLGNSLPRAKSMVSMDSQAAVELARLRSKDRALVEPDLPQQRRKSYQNLRNEAGEAKAAKRRPQSYAHDIPPVPSIDISKHRGSPAAMTRPQSEGQTMRQPDLSFSARSRERGQEVSQLVDRYDYNGQNWSQQNADAVNWEAHSHSWSQRRKSIGEGLRTRNGMAEANAASVNSRTTSRPPKEVESWGRFSGGLQYNYEGRGRIAGSAGTQPVHKLASSKSMQWKVQHGVDLSDVPIMLQRA